jgi:hypothetical protein
VRRRLRREQHVHALEQLDARAYGYLVSRTALLHPQGETFDLSMGLRGLFESLTKIAAQRDKDFGALVGQRRWKRGLSVAPAGTVLPFLPARHDHDPAEHAKLDVAAERMLQETVQGHELQAHEYDWLSGDCTKRSLRLNNLNGAATHPSSLRG